MRAWRRLEKTCGAEAAVVLEDDAILANGFDRCATWMWRSITARLPEPDMLHLTYYRHLTPQKSCVHPLANASRFVRLRCPTGLITGSQAYVVSKRGAARARQALTPLRVRGNARSFDTLLGLASMELERFAISSPCDEPARHDWDVRSVRVYGLPAPAPPGAPAPRVHRVHAWNLSLARARERRVTAMNATRAMHRLALRPAPHGFASSSFCSSALHVPSTRRWTARTVGSDVSDDQ